MEFNIAAFGIGLPIWIAVTAYAFRFFASIGRKKKPVSRTVKDGISLYLVPAALFWYYIISRLWCRLRLCDVDTSNVHHRTLVQLDSKWRTVVGLGTIVWLLHRVVKRAGQAYPTGVGPWRAILSLAASMFVYVTLYFAILLGGVAIYVHFKAPWIVDWLIEEDETRLPIQHSMTREFPKSEIVARCKSQFHVGGRTDRPSLMYRAVLLDRQPPCGRQAVTHCLNARTG